MFLPKSNKEWKSFIVKVCNLWLIYSSYVCDVIILILRFEKCHTAGFCAASRFLCVLCRGGQGLLAIWPWRFLARSFPSFPSCIASITRRLIRRESSSPKYWVTKLLFRHLVFAYRHLELLKMPPTKVYRSLLNGNELPFYDPYLIFLFSYERQQREAWANSHEANDVMFDIAYLSSTKDIIWWQVHGKPWHNHDCLSNRSCFIFTIIHLVNSSIVTILYILLMLSSAISIIIVSIVSWMAAIFTGRWWIEENKKMRCGSLNSSQLPFWSDSS